MKNIIPAILMTIFFSLIGWVIKQEYDRSIRHGNHGLNVEVDKEVQSTDSAGKFTWKLSIYHWYKGDIVRGQYLQNIRQDKIDSIVAHEKATGVLIEKELSKDEK